MKIKMIALDLDRTTLNRNGRLSDENRKVLTELLNRGIHVIPASGRSLTSFPQEIGSFYSALISPRILRIP